MSLRVLEPGLYSLLVDQGRPRTRSLGVPVGGAADQTALALGNALVGNPPGAAALEITLAGPTLQADADVAAVVFGAPFEARVGRQELRPGATFTLSAGDVLRIMGTPKGMRSYLCVRGGFDSPAILGSHSAFAPVAVNDVLSCPAAKLPVRFLRPGLTAYIDSRTLRVLDGPQAGWFHSQQFYDQEFTVTPQSNRMGLRLDGTPLTLPDRELVSEPVCPGAVQVTRDGRCIVLGVDGQTIGGYAKIAQVISADFDKLAQLRPGDRLRFIPVSLAEAEGLYRRQHDELRRWLLRVQVAQNG
jgi:antagonist of KipI